MPGSSVLTGVRITDAQSASAINHQQPSSFAPQLSPNMCITLWIYRSLSRVQSKQVWSIHALCSDGPPFCSCRAIEQNIQLRRAVSQLNS
eukprot:1047383-Pelagomonas_calceolata.AAC.4